MKINNHSESDRNFHLIWFFVLHVAALYVNEVWERKHQATQYNSHQTPNSKQLARVGILKYATVINKDIGKVIHIEI